MGPGSIVTDVSQPDEAALRDLDRRFSADFDRGVPNPRCGVRLPATYFIQMVCELGSVETAKKLVDGSKTSDGFAALWEKQQLGRSV